MWLSLNRLSFISLTTIGGFSHTVDAKTDAALTTEQLPPAGQSMIYLKPDLLLSGTLSLRTQPEFFYPPAVSPEENAEFF